MIEGFNDALKALSILAIAGVGASCGGGVFVAPAGPGEPAPDAAAAWSEATSACRGARSYSAALRLSGRSGGQGFPGVNGIVALAPGSIFLQIIGGNRPVLTLAGTAERATYFLHEDNRVVTARAEDIVETIVGVKVGPDRLLAVLAGCATRQFDVQGAARFGRRTGVTTADGQVFLERLGGRWQTVAAIVNGLTVQYKRNGSAFPTSLRMDALVAGAPAGRINISAVDQLDVNTDLPPAVFAAPAAAASATPMTLDELRTAGPFGKNSVKLEVRSQKLEVSARAQRRTPQHVR